MAEKAIDSTTKILRKIQSELTALRQEMRDEFHQVNTRLDSIEEVIAGAAATAIEARGIAERLKERVKRMENRDS